MDGGNLLNLAIPPNTSDQLFLEQVMKLVRVKVMNRKSMEFRKFIDSGFDDFKFSASRHEHDDTSSFDEES